MLTHVEYRVELLAGDCGSVRQGQCSLSRVDHPGHVTEPHFEKADLDQNQLVVLR